MRRYFAFILCGSMAANATSLSLQDALDMAMANNSKIKAEKAKVDIAESGEKEAFARFLPTVSLSAGITKINDGKPVVTHHYISGMKVSVIISLFKDSLFHPFLRQLTEHLLLVPKRIQFL